MLLWNMSLVYVSTQEHLEEDYSTHNMCHVVELYIFIHLINSIIHFNEPRLQLLCITYTKESIQFSFVACKLN